MEIPGYKITGVLGDGGMATVYQGVQLSLQRPVAIKVLKSKLIDHDEIRKRFERESIIIARLSHPNIIHVIDQGVLEDERPFFVMEYVKSIGLNIAIKKGGLTHSRALDVFTQIAKALAYAHKNHIVHCDIKPENVLVDFEGFARVLDFGIAQIYEDVESKSKDGQGFVMGSPKYMAPEQHQGITHATEKSDIYSLGVMMYFFFTKQLPRGEFPDVSSINKSVPASLNTLILKCLAHDPSKRPESADVVKHHLLQVLQGGHLNNAQHERAAFDVKKSFRLLDVVKEDEYGSVYLFEEKGERSLFVIKKKPVDSPGFEIAQKITSIKHDNIVSSLGCSKNARAFIIVMEYCGGGSLAERLVKPYELETFYAIAEQIIAGLKAASVYDVVHGNLRPTNILFNDSNMVKVSDFGLDEHYLDSKNNWYTLDGEPASVVADIYALGVIFYQMLTGELPEWKKDALVKKKRFVKLPQALQLLVRRMLARDASKRIKTYETITVEFAKLSASEKTQVRSPKSVSSKPQMKATNLELERPRRKTTLVLLLCLVLVMLVSQAYLLLSGNFEVVLSTILDAL